MEFDERPTASADKAVLVTGGTGFIASHLILRLLADGYAVHTTVRDLAREPEVRKSLEAAGARHLDRLVFYEPDLTRDDGWPAAINGCAFVHHVASPLPTVDPKSEDELIGPAREGTVRRVVLTSSFAAIGYGHPSSRTAPFTEADWSVKEGLPAYHKSKLLAEKAAWAFVEEGDKQGPELTVINPVGTFGPVLIAGRLSASLGLIQRLLDGSMSAVPQLYFGMVDARDLADLHVWAMAAPAAAGQRYLAAADGRPAALPAIALALRKERPALAAQIPAWIAPNWLVRVAALFSPAARSLVPVLGEMRITSNEKAKTQLNWQPRAIHETILATADSLVAAGLV